MKVLPFLLAVSTTANAQYFINTYAGRYTGPVGSAASSISVYNNGIIPFPSLYPFLALDGLGNKYLVPYTLGGNQIIELDSNNVVKQVYGTVQSGYAGDGASATTAQFNGILAVAGDSAGNLYIADSGNFRIRKISTLGVISTVAGTGTPGYSGDNGPSTAAAISSVQDLAVDLAGDVFIADTGNGRVRRIDATSHVITTVAGDGSLTSSGNGGPALSAGVIPATVSVDKNGNLVVTEKTALTGIVPVITAVARIVDAAHQNINSIPVPASWSLDRARYDSTARLLFTSRSYPGLLSTDLLGNVTTVAGTSVDGYSGDGSVATATEFGILRDVVSDASADLFVVDIDNTRIRRIDGTSQIVSTIAGNGSMSFSGDGALAANGQMLGPLGVAADSSGNLYIADSGNYRVRRVDAVTQNISTYAGNGQRGVNGDSGPATAAQVAPAAVAVDAHGNVYISDFFSNRVRMVNVTTQVITTVAGTGTAGFSGDTGPATAAELNQPESLALDSTGNLFIADFGNRRVRRVDAVTGKMSTVLSTANLPLSVTFQISPTGLAVDSSGNLYVSIASGGSASTSPNGVILKISPADAVSIYAGNGTNVGEGIAGVGAQMAPYGISIDSNGYLFYCDGASVRRIDPNIQVIATVAGNTSVTRGYSGDGGIATSALLDVPVSLAASNGAIYVADNLVVRSLTIPAGSTIITSIPSGLQVTADGLTYITPAAFQWTPGSAHNVVFPTQQSAGGSSYTFQSWQDGSTVPQRFIIASGATVYTATYGLTALGINPTSLPDAMQWAEYSQPVTGVGGFPPYTIQLTGGLLPPGLTFSNNLISGVPNSTGSYGFVLTITDSLSNSVTLNYTISVDTAVHFNGVGNPGVFRAGQWWLDVNGDHLWTLGIDTVFQYGQAGDNPIIGDWTNSGSNRIGIFRGGQWWLDINGDRMWTEGVDTVFTYGQPGDIPIIGDWTNSGVQRIGIFRGGQWWLDINNDHQWTEGVDTVFTYGQPGDVPVIGDWTNTGVQRIGVFRNGQWWLDINNDHQWTIGADIVFNYGQTGDIPMLGDWTNSGLVRIGIFRNGQWWLDINNDHQWTIGADIVYTFGQAGDMPVPGK